MIAYNISIDKSDDKILKELAKRLGWQIERVSKTTNDEVLSFIETSKKQLSPISKEYYSHSTFTLFCTNSLNSKELFDQELLNTLSRYPLSSKSYYLNIRTIQNGETMFYFEVDERKKEVSILQIESLL